MAGDRAGSKSATTVEIEPSRIQLDLFQYALELPPELEPEPAKPTPELQPEPLKPEPLQPAVQIAKFNAGSLMFWQTRAAYYLRLIKLFKRIQRIKSIQPEFRSCNVDVLDREITRYRQIRSEALEKIETGIGINEEHKD